MNIINPNTFHCYFNSANTEGIFAKIAAPADLMITFLTQESRYNNGKGMSWETFIVYHMTETIISNLISATKI